jgi:hypothetical protein
MAVTAIDATAAQKKIIIVEPAARAARRFADELKVLTSRMALIP